MIKYRVYKVQRPRIRGPLVKTQIGLELEMAEARKQARRHRDIYFSNKLARLVRRPDSTIRMTDHATTRQAIVIEPMVVGPKIGTTKPVCRHPMEKKIVLKEPKWAPQETDGDQLSDLLKP